MQQTLLAVAALAVFAVFALSQHRDEIHAEQVAVSAELASALAAVARDRLAAAERLAFAHEDAGRSGLRMEPPSSPLGLDPGESASAYNDLDDLLGVVENRAAVVGGSTVPVEVRYEVRYVSLDAPGAESASPTLAKEVAVVVAEMPVGGAPAERPPAEVVLRRVFTPTGLLSAQPPR